MTKIIGIPSNGPELTDSISQHFGHCQYFIGVEHNDGNQTKKVFEINNSQHSGCMQTVVDIKRKNVTDMIVSGIGGRPFMAMVQSGINVYHGTSGTVKENIERLLEGKLKPLGGPSCEEQGHGNHSNHCSSS
ncbi:MAG: NifB/NifX family molybdenum-iron cluster-binding protein [Promethearchaeota archaeon]